MKSTKFCSLEDSDLVNSVNIFRVYYKKKDRQKEKGKQLTHCFPWFLWAIKLLIFIDRMSGLYKGKHVLRY